MKLIGFGESWRKNKKYYAIIIDGTEDNTIHFGDSRYSDYTEHGDNERRDRYRARASKLKSNGKLTINSPLSPNFWSYWTLWGNTGDLQTDLKSVLKKYDIEDARS